jgi:hypothetical protein
VYAARKKLTSGHLWGLQRLLKAVTTIDCGPIDAVLSRHVQNEFNIRRAAYSASMIRGDGLDTLTIRQALANLMA